jgi:tRNA uridine 5-carboxymethylaminomethyl modification enzyme
LIGAERRQRFASKMLQMQRGLDLLKAGRVGSVTADAFLRRPEVDWDVISHHVEGLAEIDSDAAQQCLYDIKYEGYVTRQRMEVEKQHRMADKRIPDSFDYARITPLRNEAREKLTRIRPKNLDQAKRISGITPADIALVLAHLEA